MGSIAPRVEGRIRSCSRHASAASASDPLWREGAARFSLVEHIEKLRRNPCQPGDPHTIQHASRPDTHTLRCQRDGTPAHLPRTLTDARKRQIAAVRSEAVRHSPTTAQESPAWHLINARSGHGAVRVLRRLLAAAERTHREKEGDNINRIFAWRAATAVEEVDTRACEHERGFKEKARHIPVAAEADEAEVLVTRDLLLGVRGRRRRVRRRLSGYSSSHFS